jgi:lipopolysaccharide export system protein LptA
VAAAALALLAAGPARAQGVPPTGDGAAPIEIVADSLVVRQDERLAIFSGNVDATQGERSLRADELKVFYADERAGGGQGIRRIEASGRVVVAEPGQTAQGDRGVYDPTAGRIRLDGNVVLTRGDNVVRGGQLEMDLATGTATVRAARPGGPPGERVRALFVPQEGRGESRPGSGRERPSKDPQPR